MDLTGRRSLMCWFLECRQLDADVCLFDHQHTDDGRKEVRTRWSCRPHFFTNIPLPHIIHITTARIDSSPKLPDHIAFAKAVVRKPTEDESDESAQEIRPISPRLRTYSHPMGSLSTGAMAGSIYSSLRRE